MSRDAGAELPGEPPFYFPLRHGRYDVAPGLVRFGRDVGGGAADGEVFQFDRTFGRYRAAKLAARAGALREYYCASELGEAVAGEVARFVVGRLVGERPALFGSEAAGGGGARVRCALTGEMLAFDAEMRLTGVEGAEGVAPPYRDAIDALACQVQEDLAVVSVGDGRHWMSAVHVCLPNGWAPAEKVGRSFAEVHAEVAGMGGMNRRGAELVGVMAGAREGLVRFAWGVTFDDRLDHHPRHGRARFDPGRPRVFLRVERQTMWGVCGRTAAVFTIRTYLYDGEALRRDEGVRGALVAALRTMPEASRVYKGLAGSVEGVVGWLGEGGKEGSGCG